MEWVETTGRTIEEAVAQALDVLGVEESEVEYEVLSEPRGGLFGRLGGSSARIKARIRPVSMEKPGGNRRSGRSSDGRSSGGRPSNGSSSRQRNRGGRAERGARPEESERPARQPATKKAAPDKAPGSREPRATRAPRGEGDSTRQARAPRPKRTQENGEPMETATIEQQIEAAEEFLLGLLNAFGAIGTVANSVDDEEAIHVSVVGDELGLLIGQRGATLDAIEELVRTAVLRKAGGRGNRIFVDVGGYKAKRRQALGEFAAIVAAKAIETGRDQALDPMPAGDRKAVHDAVALIDGVETFSEGEDPRRRIVIRPN